MKGRPKFWVGGTKMTFDKRRVTLCKTSTFYPQAPEIPGTIQYIKESGLVSVKFDNGYTNTYMPHDLIYIDVLMTPDMELDEIERAEEIMENLK